MNSFKSFFVGYIFIVRYILLGIGFDDKEY